MEVHDVIIIYGKYNYYFIALFIRSGLSQLSNLGRIFILYSIIYKIIYK